MFVRIASARRFKQIHKTYGFLKNKNRNINEKIHDPLIFCADQIDVKTNFCCNNECRYKECSLYDDLLGLELIGSVYTVFFFKFIL